MRQHREAVRVMTLLGPADVPILQVHNNPVRVDHTLVTAKKNGARGNLKRRNASPMRLSCNGGLLVGWAELLSLKEHPAGSSTALAFLFVAMKHATSCLTFYTALRGMRMEAQMRNPD